MAQESRSPTPPDLICPEDRERLRPDESAAHYRCPRCESRYPVEKGVVRFLRDTDSFYEGRYLNTIRFIPRRENPFYAWPLWQIASGYIWAARAHVPAGATVVEVGCASGVAYFAHRYRVIGVDLSFASLARIADLYDTCLQADSTRALPLPDQSVDGIFSSFVWEHIAPDLKPKALAEFARVLRPGGKLVFLYDVECESPLFRYMKRRDRDLYREVLIDREGHAGWQTPDENRSLFEENGFRILEHRGKEKLLIAPAMYDKLREFGGWMRPFAELGCRFRSAPGYYAYNGVIRILDETLCRVLPKSWSRVMVSVCQKQ